MRFVDVWHQERALRTLRDAMAGGRLPHAYIFHGPKGVGKEMLAERLAQALLCSRRANLADDGCGSCEDCTAHAAGNHPDYHLVYRQLNKYHPAPEVRDRKALEMSVDVIRHFVIDKSSATPLRGQAKVFVIREAETMSPSAQNALLKTLEEPLGSTFLILLTASIDRLLPTTLSRCQLAAFRPLPSDFVLRKLRELRPEAPGQALELLARSCGGQLGLALEQLDDGIPEYNEKLIALLAALEPSSAPALVKFLEEGGKDLGAKYRQREPDASDTEGQRVGIYALFRLIGLAYRDVMLLTAGKADGLVNTAHGNALRAMSASVTAEFAADVIDLTARTEQRLAQNANIQLSLEALAYQLARRRVRAPTAAG